MKCPNCGKDADYELYEQADDYQDGVIICMECGKDIATFNFTVIVKTIETAMLDL